jgi:hypothetical protein
MMFAPIRARKATLDQKHETATPQLVKETLTAQLYQIAAATTNPKFDPDFRPKPTESENAR